MHPALRLGCELPPIAKAPAPGDPAPRPAPGVWTPTPAGARAVIAAVQRSGHDAVWLKDGPEGVLEPLTLAAGLSRDASTLLFGVAVSLHGGRHPSVLARDLSGLDSLIPARSLLLLQARASGPKPDPAGVAVGEQGDDDEGSRVDDLERLREAAAICRALLAGGPATYTGRFYRLEGAVNRPRPTGPHGPPIVVDVTAVPLGSPEARGSLAATVSIVDAFTIDGPPAQVQALCSLVGGDGPSVLWRGSLADDGPTGLEPARAAIESGAGGILWRLPPPGVGESVHVDPARLGAIGAALRSLLDEHPGPTRA